MERLSCKVAKGRRDSIHEVRLGLKDLLFEPIHEYLDNLLLGCSQKPLVTELPPSFSREKSLRIAICEVTACLRRIGGKVNGGTNCG